MKHIDIHIYPIMKVFEVTPKRVKRVNDTVL